MISGRWTPFFPRLQAIAVPHSVTLVKWSASPPHLPVLTENRRVNLTLPFTFGTETFFNPASTSLASFLASGNFGEYATFRFAGSAPDSTQSSASSKSCLSWLASPLVMTTCSIALMYPIRSSWVIAWSSSDSGVRRTTSSSLTFPTWAVSSSRAYVSPSRNPSGRCFGQRD